MMQIEPIRDKNNIFYWFIRNWYGEFKYLAQQALNSGRKLYIIAISRKMPRFFSWLTKHEEELGIYGLSYLLDSAEYTTEHSLPFIFFQEDHDDYEVIVVDDSMVLGNTVRRVSQDVVTYTNGKKPQVSILVSSERTYSDLKNIEFLHRPNDVDEGTLTEWLEFVSLCNAKSELPVDVEFPILHILGSSKESYIRQIENTVPMSEWCELTEKDTVCSVNVLLDEEIVELSSLDFSKSRCFFYQEEMKLSVFSPFAILQSSIFDGYIFRDHALNDIWEEIKGTVRNRTEKRTYQSLVVVINYLNALNTFKRNKNLIFPRDAQAFRIEVPDLQLLLGRSLASSLIGRIHTSLSDDSKQGFLITQPDLPGMQVPKELELSYRLQRKLLASARRGDRNISLLISSVFDQARYDKSIMGRNTTVFHRMHSAFFESYDSLRQLIEFYFDVDNLNLLLNETVDRLIDEGRIIPQYVQVLNKQRQTYWRRYFTSAHSSVEL